MKSKTISEALEEIWEIKERIYQEDKDCSILESLKRAHKVTEQVLKERKKEYRRSIGTFIKV